MLIPLFPMGPYERSHMSYYRSDVLLHVLLSSLGEHTKLLLILLTPRCLLFGCILFVTNTRARELTRLLLLTRVRPTNPPAWVAYNAPAKPSTPRLFDESLLMCMFRYHTRRRLHPPLPQPSPPPRRKPRSASRSFYSLARLRSIL